MQFMQSCQLDRTVASKWCIQRQSSILEANYFRYDRSCKLKAKVGSKNMMIRTSSAARTKRKIEHRKIDKCRSEDSTVASLRLRIGSCRSCKTRCQLDASGSTSLLVDMFMLEEANCKIWSKSF